MISIILCCLSYCLNWLAWHTLTKDIFSLDSEHVMLTSQKLWYGLLSKSVQNFNKYTSQIHRSNKIIDRIDNLNQAIAVDMMIWQYNWKYCKLLYCNFHICGKMTHIFSNHTTWYNNQLIKIYCWHQKYNTECTHGKGK